MTTLSDIAPVSDFQEAVDANYVRTQTHPTLPLTIYNYTEQATFSRVWNPVTLAARGLIVNSETLEIIARPLGKFFNYSENDVPLEAMSGAISVSDKLDGSLGISYPTPNGLAIATRGSFMSDQAIHATEVYNERYNGKWEPKADTTYVFEIIYPSNRIVVDYAGMDDIILLASVNNATGVSTPAAQVPEWLWNKVSYFEFSSLEEVINAPQTKNSEGFVVHFLDTDARVKFKFDEYIVLHRILTGVTPLRVWEIVSSGIHARTWLRNEAIPEEFIVGVETYEAKLRDSFIDVNIRMVDDYARVLRDLPEGFTQKDFALEVQKLAKANVLSVPPGLMFSFHQAGNLTPKMSQTIWALLRPEGTEVFE